MFQRIVEKIDNVFTALAEKLIMTGYFFGLDRRWSARVFVVITAMIFNYPTIRKSPWFVSAITAIVLGAFISFVVLALIEKEFDRQSLIGTAIYDSPRLRLLLISMYPGIMLIIFVIGEIFAPTHSYWKIIQYLFNPYFSIYFIANQDTTTRFKFKDISRVLKRRMARKFRPYRVTTTPIPPA